MASISTDPNGKKRILFVAPDGKRKTLYLGKVPKREAEAFKLRVERLDAAQQSNLPIDADTAGWIGSLSDPMASKLAKVGLIDHRENATGLTLGEHLNNYFSKRTDVKPATVTNWGHTQRNLLQFFKPYRLLSSITAGDARDFERWLRTSEARENRYANTDADQGLSPNTARKRISNAKQFFEDAVQRELITRNPFKGLKGTVGSNRERDYFLNREDAQRILDACPDAQWRLIFALSRFGGLRCPSEHLALTWADIDWHGKRIRVTSSKTERYEGKGERWIPMFPELRPHLEAVWEQSKTGDEHIITRYRRANVNLSTQLKRIIRRAGLTPWPKLYQNLRASRATELASEHPAHVAAAWLGHSTVVASKHYWQITDADFERAICGDEKATQNTTQHMHAGGGTDSQASPTGHKKTPVVPVPAPQCENLPTGVVGVRGLEPLTSSMSRKRSSQLS